MEPGSLHGITALVTGGASGLGHAIAVKFLEEGGNVVICDVNNDRLQHLVEAWNKGAKYTGRTLLLQTDVTDESSVNKLMGEIVARFGRLDILVNNAGIMDKFDPVGSCDKTLWDRVLAVNLTGPFITSKAAVNQMEAQEPAGGIIINIGSNSSYQGLFAGAAYTVSKHGIMGLTKNTAGFYGPKGIYAMALLLGGMETNISDAFAAGFNQEAMKRTFAAHPGFVMGETSIAVDHVANYCAFLANRDMAAAANGSCIVLNKNWPVA